LRRKTDMPTPLGDVCFQGQSGHRGEALQCPL
jgi:hypothetical protein